MIAHKAKNNEKKPKMLITIVYFIEKHIFILFFSTFLNSFIL